MRNFHYGTVFLLEEDFADDYLRACFSAMRGLDMNTVVLWPPVFYRPDGARDFSVQRRALDVAAECGIEAVVELTGQVADLEYLPDYLYRDDLAVVDVHGVVQRAQNGLGEMNYNHPEVQEHLREFFHAAARALGDHPALCAWDIWNETHFLSYDAYTRRLFQGWLQKKYGDVAALNRAWRRSYTAFAQVKFEGVTWASVSADTDWEEFRADNLRDVLAAWAGWLREVDPSHPIIADNVMANAVIGGHGRGTDDALVAATVDRYGISFYPKTGGRLLKDDAPYLRDLTFAGAAMAGGGSFMVSEMQSHCYSGIFTAERVSGAELARWNLEALCRGACGNVYWKWAPFRSGFQIGGRGLTLPDGRMSPRAAAAGELGRLYAANPDLGALKPECRAAVLFSMDNNRMVKAVNNRVRHLIGDDQPVRALQGLFAAAWRCNLPLALVNARGEGLAARLSGYRALFLPYQIRLDAPTATAIRDFVAAGGALVADAPCGSIDAGGLLYHDLPGGPLNAMLGAKLEDNLEIPAGVPVEWPGREKAALTAAIEVEKLTLPPDAAVIAAAGGVPLAFHRLWGKGAVVYAATPLWTAADAGAPLLADMLLETLVASDPALRPLAAAPGCRALLCRAANGARFLFGFNDPAAPEAEAWLELPEGAEGWKALFGAPPRAEGRRLHWRGECLLLRLV